MSRFNGGRFRSVSMGRVSRSDLEKQLKFEKDQHEKIKNTLICLLAKLPEQRLTLTDGERMIDTSTMTLQVAYEDGIYTLRLVHVEMEKPNDRLVVD